IGPGLGERSIELGMQSMLFGGLAVLAFMIWYYRTSGLVAVICVMLNVLMILGVMQFIRSTFTLPGIAGIVLTIGMAVDGNVLIYERIREELDRGKAVLQAVRAGFDRAMITIFDANLTTLIAGLVLYNVGIGPIRGFAVSLNVGIVTTMFTSFFVCRVVFHYLLQWGLLKEIRMRKWLTHVNVDWMKPAKALVTGSGILILIGLVNFAATPRDVSLGLDFTGGASMQIVLKEPLTRAQLIDRLREDAAFRADFPNAQVTTVGEVKDGKATQFNLKLKLSDQVAERMQQEKAKAKAEGRAFEPPYTRHVLRLLAASLVDQPSSGAELVENPTNPSAKFATLTLHFATPVRVQDLQAKLAVPLPNARVRSADKESPETSKNLTVEFQVEASTTPEQLFPLVKGYLGDLRDTGNQPVELSSPIPEASELGGRLVGELRNAAIGAMVLSLFLVTMYVRVRFHEFKYGIAAVVALLHDVLMSFGVVVAANRLGLVDVELDIGMIAAFLTIVGFSINDTIVIFDRVRENLQDQARLGDTKETFEQLLNRSVNQTMSRTLLTSATVLFVVLAQFLVNYHNQSPLEGFSFTLLIGFLSGVYSTVYIASPVVLWLHNRELRRGGAPGATAGHSPLPTAPATSRA
ncbi:MAG: protein translocase subunit SecF, partial [Planctomycetes bacterium]|nr:protein translocase subunit SecF [Planctomycetota bacterium]